MWLGHTGERKIIGRAYTRGYIRGPERQDAAGR